MRMNCRMKLFMDSEDFRKGTKIFIFAPLRPCEIFLKNKTTMKCYILIAIVFGITRGLLAQNNPEKDTLIWQLSATVRASELDAFFNLRKWDSYVRYNHPKLVQLMGGAEKMTETVTQQMKTIESEVTIDSFGFGKPINFVKCVCMMNCLLSQTIVITQKKDAKSIRVTNFLLGVSEDEGSTWYFIDPDIGNESMDKIIPNRCKNLKIPPRKLEIKNKE